MCCKGYRLRPLPSTGTCYGNSLLTSNISRQESVPSASLLQAAPTSPIPIPRRTLSPPQASATPPLDYDYPDTPRSYPSSPLQFWHYTNDPLPIGPFSPPAAAQVPVSAPMYSQPDAFVGYPSPTFRYWPAQYGSLPNYDHSIKYQYSPPFIAAPSPEMQYNWTMPDQFGQKPEEPRTMPSLFPSDQQSAFLPGPSNQAYDYGSNRRNGQPE